MYQCIFLDTCIVRFDFFLNFVLSFNLIYQYQVLVPGTVLYLYRTTYQYRTWDRYFIAFALRDDILHKNNTTRYGARNSRLPTYDENKIIREGKSFWNASQLSDVFLYQRAITSVVLGIQQFYSVTSRHQLCKKSSRLKNSKNQHQSSFNWSISFSIWHWVLGEEAIFPLCF